MAMGGSWSAYWYNGVIVSSEIARGLDIFELTPSAFISQNEIDAAKTVHLDYLNAQGQPKFVWPPSFALARAYVDQLERSNGLVGGTDRRGAAARCRRAEQASGSARSTALTRWPPRSGPTRRDRPTRPRCRCWPPRCAIWRARTDLSQSSG